MKSVLVVGGGPGGLVAAKTLKQHGFKVSLFEAADHVGGLWPVSIHQDDKIVDAARLRTNLSRFNVSFSDLNWHSVDFAAPQGDYGKNKTAFVSMYPKAWQVGKYLQAYASKYLHDIDLRLRARVTSAELQVSEQISKWKVRWELSSNAPTVNDSATTNCYTTQESEFDFLVMATGFYSLPAHYLKQHSNGKKPTTVHTGQFRTVESLINPKSTDDSNIVVIGGGISGAEAAATAAFQISNLRHRPEESHAAAQLKIHHVLGHPFYPLPRYASKPSSQENENGSKNFFFPMDMTAFDFIARPIKDKPYKGAVTPEVAAQGHGFLGSLIAFDKPEYKSAPIQRQKNPSERPGYIAVTEMYAEFVRSGEIIQHSGRGLMNAASDVIAREAPSDPEEAGTAITDIAAIIDGKGYQPDEALKLLSKNVLDKLEYDVKCTRLPVLLIDHATRHPSIRNLAFAGFYEASYWGVMEMQARLIAQNWSSSPPPSFLDTSNEETELADLRALRAHMNARNPLVPQQWNNDFPGLVESAAERLSLPLRGPAERIGPVIPSRYLAPGDDESEAQQTLDELAATIENASHGAFAPRAIFPALQGIWSLNRDIVSQRADFPSGTFIGTAHFHPRDPTDQAYDAEFLYIENGTFTQPSTGLEFSASRRYVYRYAELTDEISVWFVATEPAGSTAVDAPFYTMEFTPSRSESWTAVGKHWCAPDQYDVQLAFRMAAANIRDLEIVYDVKGPQKDYRSTSRYERPG